MDEKDEQILGILKKNAKLSTHKISQRTGIPVTTVHNRIKRLEKQGIIKNYSIYIDYEKLGLGISALVLASLDHKVIKEHKLSLKEIMSKILKIKGVQRAFTVTGSKDFVMRIRAKDIAELDKILTQDFMEFDFIADTETMIITHDLRA